jgi:hypothetical protein
VGGRLEGLALVHAQLIALLAGVGAYAQLGLCLGDTHGDAEHTLPAVMRAVLPTLALEHGTDAKALSAQRECVDFVALAVEGQLSMAGVTEEGGKRAAAALQDTTRCARDSRACSCACRPWRAPRMSAS